MFIFLSVNIVWYRQKCYAEVVIFQTNGSSLFVASVARRRRRFVYDVSVCPVGDMDGPENPKTAQVMSNANKMPSQTSGLYRRFGLYIMSGGFVIQPGSQMCNFARAWGLWVIITVRFFFLNKHISRALHLHDVHICTTCLPTGQRKCCCSTCLWNGLYTDPTPS